MPSSAIKYPVSHELVCRSCFHAGTLGSNGSCGSVSYDLDCKDDKVEERRRLLLVRKGEQRGHQGFHLEREGEE